MSLAALAVGVGVTGTSQPPTTAGSVTAEADAPTSVFVDGRGFEEAITSALSEFNRSALLDEAAFQELVAQGVDQLTADSSE